MKAVLHPYILFFVLALLAAASFLFSASETSIISLSKIRLRHMLSKGIRGAQRIQRLLAKSDSFISAILIGNNFVNIAMSAVITAISVSIFGYNWGVVIATFSTALFVLIACEITPKILAIKHSERIAIFAAPIMELFIKIFHPFISVFTGIANLILKGFGVESSPRSPLITEEELRLMIEIGKEEGVLTDEERKMLHRIFEFGGTKVGDVMVPKEKIMAVNINSTSEEALNVFAEEGHARLPVYEGSIDNIRGIIYARDLLYILKDKGLFVLQDLMHPPYCIPHTTRVNELLMKFQTDKIQIAVIVDSQNKTLGLVTLEDLIEEIVGEVEEAPKRRRRAK